MIPVRWTTSCPGRYILGVIMTNPEKSPDITPDTTAPEPEPQPAEIGGRDGPDPTRYGDWEKNGRCIDF